MDIFDIGETVICTGTVRNAAGTLTDPANSMKIVIDRLKPTLNVVASVGMESDTAGIHYYDFQSVNFAAGTYMATYTATDGTRITIEKALFQLE